MDSDVKRWAEEEHLDKECIEEMVKKKITNRAMLQHICVDDINKMDISDMQKRHLTAIISDKMKSPKEVPCNPITADSIRDEMQKHIYLKPKDRQIFQAVSSTINANKIPDWVLKNSEINVEGELININFWSGSRGSKYRFYYCDKNRINFECLTKTWVHAGRYLGKESFSFVGGVVTFLLNAAVGGVMGIGATVRDAIGWY